MNTSHLHRALNEGKLDTYIESLSDEVKKQLIDKLKWELVNYKCFCRNYSAENRKEYSTPYIEKREKLKTALNESLGEQLV